ncbi:CAC [Symbiodinium sp. CCMP2456]|nr:CAC [Symbiodinium sp. CCMP2456]
MLDPNQRQIIFAKFLDASWQIFRSQMLEAYAETALLEAPQETLPALKARVRSLEAEVSKVCEVTRRELETGQVVERYDHSFLPPKESRQVELLYARSTGSESPKAPTPKAASVMEPLEEDTSMSDQVVSRQNTAGESIVDQEVGSQVAAGDGDPLLHREDSDSALHGVRQRLQVRLGAMSSNKLITGKMLVNTVEALGLTTYSEEDMNQFVNTLADYIDLRFVKKEGKNGFRRSHSSSNVFQFQDEDQPRDQGKPVWHWPQEGELQSHQGSREGLTKQEEKTRPINNAVPLKPLMDILVRKDKELPKKVFGHAMMAQFQAMKEILLAGDTNRLVAELTFVRINDLAAPPEKIHPLIFIEPFVAVLIIANGIMIGFQTDPLYEDWGGWIYLEVVFAVVLVVECAFRVHLSGWKNYFCGTDYLWNYFDLFLLLTGLTDIVVEVAVQTQSDFFGASLLRFCRLIRLVRVVKVFRLKYMKELRLMVKGLVGGFRTLFLSFALLFAVLYVIAGFATMTIGRDSLVAELGLTTHFQNIPASMFTAFRCFSGECFAASGLPIAAVLEDSHGLPFVLGYVVCYMLVSLGIYNVILAVYVDITMRAAKESEAVTAEQHSRESIRIARTTRELLKKFAAAYRQFQDLDENETSNKKHLDFSPMESNFTDEDIHGHIAITKELFLLVIQDQSVQFLMDELELPHDRANLFEIIDADGSGTLHVTELVQGLLKIRGEVKKSDAVATLLATKAIQNQLVELRTDEKDFQNTVLKLLQPGRISVASTKIVS